LPKKIRQLHLSLPPLQSKKQKSSPSALTGQVEKDEPFAGRSPLCESQQRDPLLLFFDKVVVG
jgi:hypothetical protein